MSTKSKKLDLGGIGASVKRKEDARFLRGAGKFVDDIELPHMLHMAFVRSPLAHARVTKIDAEAALALPGVVAVVTGKDLEAHKLAWMPTLSGDTQAVMVTDKVRFQGQEIAAVIAEDAYVARDAVELVEVDTIRYLRSWIRRRRSVKTRRSYATTKKVRRTIVAITGKRATLRLPMKRSRRPIESSSSRRITRAPIRRLSKRAAASPTSTRRPAK